MLASVYALLQRAVDYAGMFPPAALGLSDAIAEYARARNGPEGWLLDRFVIRLDHLEEFERLAPQVLSDRGGEFWALAVIVPAGAIGQIDRLRDFNERGQGSARISAIEFAPVPPSRIATLAELARADDTELFFETPLDADLGARLREVKAVGAAAKVRTGGVTADTIPPAEALAEFLSGAHEAGVAFKATAGLHHALRAAYPLTYDSHAATSTMHGFLNLAVAAANVQSGGVPADTLGMLLETAPDAFQFRPDGLRWRNRTIESEMLAETRRGFFRSFGSCAIREPVDDLRRLRIL